jgi:hypothetical protein
MVFSITFGLMEHCVKLEDISASSSFDSLKSIFCGQKQ